MNDFHSQNHSRPEMNQTAGSNKAQIHKRRETKKLLLLLETYPRYITLYQSKYIPQSENELVALKTLPFTIHGIYTYTHALK